VLWLCGNDFDGGGFAEGIDIRGGRVKVFAEVGRAAGFRDHALIGGSREVKLFEGPVALLDAMAQDQLNGALVKDPHADASNGNQKGSPAALHSMTQG